MNISVKVHLNGKHPTGFCEEEMKRLRINYEKYIEFILICANNKRIKFNHKYNRNKNVANIWFKNYYTCLDTVLAVNALKNLDIRNKENKEEENEETKDSDN